MVTEQDFKRAMSRWASGVAVISTQDAKGTPLGFTATSFTSLSLNPPLVLFCLSVNASVTEGFRNAPGFVVNILGAEHQEMSRQFSSQDADRFRGIAHAPGLLGMPVLKDALSTLECRTQAIYPGGDHWVFMGEVHAARHREGAPLLYFSGGYSTL